MSEIVPVTDLRVGDQFVFDGAVYVVDAGPTNLFGTIEVGVDDPVSTLDFQSGDTVQVVVRG